MTAELPRSRNWINDRPPLVRMECADSLLSLGTCQGCDFSWLGVCQRIGRFPSFSACAIACDKSLPWMRHVDLRIRTGGSMLLAFYLAPTLDED